MMRSLKDALRRKVEVDPARRDALEPRVMEAFERQVPVKPRPHLSPAWKLASAVAVLVALFFAGQAPAERRIEVGRRIELVLRGEPQGDLGQRLLEAISPEDAPRTQVALRVKKTPDGEVHAVIDLWKSGLPEETVIAERARRIPGVEPASVKVTRLEGQLRDTVFGTLLRRAVTPEQREQLRQQILDDLRAREGEGAEVDVQIRQDGARQQIEVKATRRQ